MNSDPKPSKLAIAQSFSKAAASYDQAAELQRRIGYQLLDYIPSDYAFSQIVDLGCGTGYFTQQLKHRFNSAQLVGVDLAEGMLKLAQQRVEGSYWLTADAEQLPLASQSVDLIFSNLAVQWCHDFSKVLIEAHRVLKPQGVFIFSSLCEGSLFELQNSWQKVDDYTHVNRFLPCERYQQLLTASPLRLNQCELKQEQSFYPTLNSLMQDLKAIGAHNINPTRNKGLTTHRQFRKLLTAYEHYRGEEGLPITYHVIYGSLIRR